VAAAPAGQAANPSAQQAFIQTPARAPARNATITPELGSAADYSYEPEMLLQRRSPATAIGVLGLIGAALVGLFLVLQSGDSPDVEVPEVADSAVSEVENEAEAESSQAETIEATQAASEGEEAAGGTDGGGQADSDDGTKVDPANSESGNSAVENAGSTKKSSKTGSSRGSTSRGSSTKKKKKTKKKSAPSKAEKADSRDSGRVIHELMMLRAAKQSLGSNPSQALAYTSQHASEFPHSQLKEQRYEIRIRALCKLGRKTQAKNEVDKIMARKRSSKARSHYNRYCG